MNVCTFSTQVFGIILWYIKVKERWKEKRHVFFTADVRTCKNSLHFCTTAILLIYESIAEVRTIKKLHLYSCEPPNESIDWLSRQPKCLLRAGRGRGWGRAGRREVLSMFDMAISEEKGLSSYLLRTWRSNREGRAVWKGGVVMFISCSHPKSHPSVRLSSADICGVKGGVRRQMSRLIDWALQDWTSTLLQLSPGSRFESIEIWNYLLKQGRI